MKTLFFIIFAAFSAPLAYAGAFEDLPADKGGSVISEVPAPTEVEMPRSADNKSAMDACPQNMKGDMSRPCFIATRKTTVCSDGEKVSTAKVGAKDVKAGKFDVSALGKYKNEDLQKWAEYQQKLGKDSKWRDGSHQSVLASGKADPLQTAYVVLPNREWLGRDVTVCVTASGLCTEAKALEVGPKTTFRSHSELSVRALMNLGLDANPENGTYDGEVTFVFH